MNVYDAEEPHHPSKIRWLKKPSLCLFMWRGCKHRHVWVGRQERCADCGMVLP